MSDPVEEFSQMYELPLCELSARPATVVTVETTFPLADLSTEFADPAAIEHVESLLDRVLLSSLKSSTGRVGLLIEEIRRLLLTNHNLQRLVGELQSTLVDRERDCKGLELEWHDQQDQVVKLEQELAVCREVLGIKRREIDDLRELKEALERAGADNEPTVLDGG